MSLLLSNCRAQEIPFVNERSASPHQQYRKISKSPRLRRRPSCLQSPDARSLLSSPVSPDLGTAIKLTNDATFLRAEPAPKSSRMKAYIAKHLLEHVGQIFENCGSHYKPCNKPDEHRDSNIDRDNEDQSIFQTFLPWRPYFFLTGQRLAQESAVGKSCSRGVSTLLLPGCPHDNVIAIAPAVMLSRRLWMI